MSTRGRAFCFTINNYTPDNEEFCKNLECQYIQYGREVAPTTGTPHLQGYVYFTNPRSFNSVRTLFAPHHIELCRGSADSNIIYTGKEGDIFRKGDPPKSQKAQGETEKDRWKGMYQAAVEGRFEDIPTQEYIRFRSTFKRIHLEDRPDPDNLERAATYGIWIYGPTNCGKSHFARTNYTPHHLKLINKWWDGYFNEPYVIIDEVEPQHGDFLKPYVKTWADRWTFRGEVKGGTLLMRPKYIVITSNYTIEQVFGKDAPILRRFEVKHMTEQYVG